MKRRLPTKKILVAAIGVGAVSYVVACGQTADNSNPAADGGRPADARDDRIVSSGNLLAPGDTGVPNPRDSAIDVVIGSGNLMAPIDSGPPVDANDDGG